MFITHGHTPYKLLRARNGTLKKNENISDTGRKYMKRHAKIGAYTDETICVNARI